MLEWLVRGSGFTPTAVRLVSGHTLVQVVA